MSDMRQMTALGRKIEDDSFGIIDAEVGEHDLPDAQWQIVRRVIHATADFEFLQTLQFSEGAIESGVAALQDGCALIVDVQMIAAGLNAARLRAYGCKVHQFISDEDVIASAKAAGSTRAIESMRKAHALGHLDGSIVAIGNAPTALLEVLRLANEEGVRPALVVGVPVGFVSAVESKDALIASSLPFIAAQGRKGGSSIAVSIIHALLVLSTAPSANPSK